MRGWTSGQIPCHSTRDIVHSRDEFPGQVKSFQRRIYFALLLNLFTLFVTLGSLFALATGALFAIISADSVLATIAISCFATTLSIGGICGMAYVWFRICQPIRTAQKALDCPICENSSVRFSHWTHMYHCCPRCGFDPFSGQQRFVVREHRPIVHPENYRIRLFFFSAFAVYFATVAGLMSLLFLLETRAGRTPEWSEFLPPAIGLALVLLSKVWVVHRINGGWHIPPHLECAQCQTSFTFPDTVNSNACRKCRAILVNAFPPGYQTKSDVESSEIRA